MMTGYLAQKHSLRLGHNRVGKALAEVATRNVERRRMGAHRQINPVPYRVDYFDHKLHVDRNEKLVMCGVTHIIAIDGHSRFIAGSTTMPIKNNALIYDEVFP